MNKFTILNNFRPFPCATSYIRNFSGPKPCRPKRHALCILTPQYEAIEFATNVTVLRRGGVDVKIASTCGLDLQTSTKGICVKPEVELEKICGNFDAIVMQGCLEAAENMGKNKKLGEMLKEQECNCKIIGAICEAPQVLIDHGIGKGRNVTAYPTITDKLKECGYCVKCDGVVVHDFLITGRGPAFAMVFALTILMHLTDECNATKVAKDLLVK